MDYTSDGSRSDVAMADLNIQVDVTPVFNWNVKQVFLYLVAEYSTPTTPVNQVSFFIHLGKFLKKVFIRFHQNTRMLSVISLICYIEARQYLKTVLPFSLRTEQELTTVPIHKKCSFDHPSASSKFRILHHLVGKPRGLYQLVQKSFMPRPRESESVCISSLH